MNVINLVNSRDIIIKEEVSVIIITMNTKIIKRSNIKIIGWNHHKIKINRIEGARNFLEIRKTIYKNKRMTKTVKIQEKSNKDSIFIILVFNANLV